MGEPNNQSLSKGDRAVITSGKNPIGTRGEIFWIGQNKYGPGMRYGLKSEDGETFWVDEPDIAAESAASDVPPPPPKPVSQDTGPAFERGAAVKVIKGPSTGNTGEVFWVGDSKYGNGSRYGMKSADGETHWVDHSEVEGVDGAPRASASSESIPAPSYEEASFQGEGVGGGSAGGFEDAPFPDEGFPEMTASADEEMPPLEDNPFTE